VFFIVLTSLWNICGATHVSADDGDGVIHETLPWLWYFCNSVMSDSGFVTNVTLQVMVVVFM
jgi:hypothetical protein